MDQFAGGQTGKPWTPFEIEAVVAAYFDMLRREQRGERYTKATIVRELQAIMPARSRGSVELKLQNISAVLFNDGRDWIDGYKPMSNYQKELAEVVAAHIRGDRRLVESLADYGTSVLVAPQLRPLTTDEVVVPPPGLAGGRVPRSSVNLVAGTMSSLRDFQTKRLGDAGEAWVVDLERGQLMKDGRPDLAQRVEWSAREIGDGLGYDVKSFHADGRERLIEVKTTNYGVRTPFYITRAEVAFSERRASDYSLYRVHGFARDPRIYILDGSVAERARLEPSVYLGYTI